MPIPAKKEIFANSGGLNARNKFGMIRAIPRIELKLNMVKLKASKAAISGKIHFVSSKPICLTK